MKMNCQARQILIIIIIIVIVIVIIIIIIIITILIAPAVPSIVGEINSKLSCKYSLYCLHLHKGIDLIQNLEEWEDCHVTNYINLLLCAEANFPNTIRPLWLMIMFATSFGVVGKRFYYRRVFVFVSL